MAELAQLRVVGGTFQAPSVPAEVEGVSFSDGGGGNGGDGVDTDTKNYLDAKVDAVKAQNDARFSEVLSGISRVSERVSNIATPMTWQQHALTTASVGLVLLGVVFAALSYASDRFDGGISASGLLDEYSQSQASRDAAQDVQFTAILETLEKIRTAQEELNKIK